MLSNYHFKLEYLTKPLEYNSILLYQIGRLYCTETTLIDTHFHLNWFELTIVTDGSGTVTTNGVASPIRRGDIYLSFPYESHKIETNSDEPLKYDFFAFHSNREHVRSELSRIVENYCSPDKRLFQDSRIRTLIGNAIAEFGAEQAGKEEVLNAIFQQTLIYLIRNFQTATQGKEYDTVTQPEAFCYRVMHYIDSHIDSIKNLEELADVTGYSYGYLSTLFKKTTSSTLAQYYYGKKAEIARLLILEKRLKISEIAELLNYTSVYAFSKAFRNWYGCSPRNYVRQAESAESDRLPPSEGLKKEYHNQLN